jgi:hypothetical protein
VIGDDGNERIDVRIESLDAGERCFYEIGGRDFPFAQEACGVLDGKESQLGF